jgi:hypothetical protein
MGFPLQNRHWASGSSLVLHTLQLSERTLSERSIKLNDGAEHFAKDPLKEREIGQKYILRAVKRHE